MKIHLPALLFLPLLASCGGIAVKETKAESLIWNHAGLPRVDTLDGIGRLLPDRHREISGKSNLVILGSLEFSFATGSMDVPVFSGSERKMTTQERLCLFFSVEEMLVGHWPSSGIVIEAWDSQFLEGLNGPCFPRTGDQYLLYFECSSPMESEKIYAKRLTDENAEQAHQPKGDVPVPHKRGR